MGVLRAWRDTILSVLEPFIHDPLVEWKKSTAGAPTTATATATTAGKAAGGGGGDIASTALGAESENMEGVRTVKRIGERLEGFYNAGAEFLARQKNKAPIWPPAGGAAGKGAIPTTNIPSKVIAPMTALEIKGQVHRLLLEATSDALLMEMC